MKRLLNLIALLLLALTTSPGLQAAEYGIHPEQYPKRYVVSKGKKLNVRNTPSKSGGLLLQLRPGDIVYMNPETQDIVLRDGEAWIKVVDGWGKPFHREGYIASTSRLVEEDNPLFDSNYVFDEGLEKAVESTQQTTKWILLGLSLLLAFTFIFRYFRHDGKDKILGPEIDGMRRTFFFNSAPYNAVLVVTGLLAAALVGAVATLLLVGGAGFVLLWIVKILCYAVVWVGIILCVICAIATVCGAIPAVIGVLIGGAIWYYDEPIEAFGEKCATTGLDFFNELNIFSYTYGLVVEYWQQILIAVCTPMALFLGLACLWLVFAGALMLFEKIMTKRYSVKHPCPHCQHDSEPAVYLTEGPEGYEALPNGIKLRPGTYGLFHITHPVSGERMPTMLLNGRDTLPRICANCGAIINAEEGTELHVVMVGSTKSGKSTLTYRMIAEIFERGGEGRVKFTDEDLSIMDPNMIGKIERIRQKGRIEQGDLPDKTQIGDTASTQLIIKRHHAPLPYRLFINDVGGEIYAGAETGNTKSFDTRFFRNVNSIVLVLDPLTTSMGEDYDTSDAYTEWLSKFETKGKEDKTDLNVMRDAIADQLHQHGKKMKDVHLNIVLPKRDLGYIPPTYDLDSQESLVAYLREEMGLAPLLNWAEGFASFSCLTVGATVEGGDSNIAKVVDHIVAGQLGVKF